MHFQRAMSTRSVLARCPPLTTKGPKMISMKATLISLLLAAAGCAVTAADAPAPEPSAHEEAQPRGAVDLGAGGPTTSGLETTTTYFAEPQHLNVVGECEFRTCLPKGKFCTGTTSPYKVVASSPCS